VPPHLRLPKGVSETEIREAVAEAIEDLGSTAPDSEVDGFLKSEYPDLFQRLSRDRPIEARFWMYKRMRISLSPTLKARKRSKKGSRTGKWVESGTRLGLDAITEQLAAVREDCRAEVEYSERRIAAHGPLVVGFGVTGSLIAAAAISPWLHSSPAYPAVLLGGSGLVVLAFALHIVCARLESRSLRAQEKSFAESGHLLMAAARTVEAREGIGSPGVLGAVRSQWRRMGLKEGRLVVECSCGRKNCAARAKVIRDMGFDLGQPILMERPYPDR
jgi:hypothetical protein